MIRTLLGEGEFGNRLFRQVAESVELQRSTQGGDYRLVLPETTENLLIDLDDDVVSDWQCVRDSLTGARLEFRVMLRRGGFFGALEGRAQDGDWPGTWRIDGAELSTLRPLGLTELAGEPWWVVASARRAPCRLNSS